MKKAAILGCIMAAGLLCGCTEKAPVPKLENVKDIGNNTFSCSFDGVSHDYILDLPEKSDGAPLIVMLHGYGSSAEDFRSTLHFEEKANPKGYAVVYVTGASDPTDRTSSRGWNSYADGSGNKDREFLVALAEYLQKEYALDREHIFAAGFSNGAFMTHRPAMEAGNTYSAVASVSGMMNSSVWEERSSCKNVGFFQITGEKDDVVPKNSDGTAEYTESPAIEDVMDYWVSSNGLELSSTTEIGKGSELKKYTAEGKRAQVWNLFIRSGGHSWPSVKTEGIDAQTLILEFFEAQR